MRRIPKVEYVTHSGVRVTVGGEGGSAADVLDLLTYGYKYEVGTRGITGATMSSREAYVRAVLPNEYAERCLSAFVDDVESGKPGTLEIEGWSTRAYVPEWVPSARRQWGVAVEMVVVLVDGVWRSPQDKSFSPRSAGSAGMNYPHNYPHNYGMSVVAGEVRNESPVPSEFTIVVYGPATNPSVTIGGNRYQVDVSVPDGGYLVIDSLNMGTDSVRMVTQSGDVSNEFHRAVRGSGQGSGEYIFEPIQPGYSPVEWDGSFGFDLTVYRKEAALPCYL